MSYCAKVTVNISCVHRVDNLESLVIQSHTNQCVVVKIFCKCNLTFISGGFLSKGDHPRSSYIKGQKAVKNRMAASTHAKSFPLPLLMDYPMDFGFASTIT